MKKTLYTQPIAIWFLNLKSKIFFKNILHFLLFILIMQGQDLSAQTAYVFKGSISTDWNDPLNWTPNGVPSFQDTVLISTSTLDASTGENIKIAALYFFGGVISGSDTLIVSDTVSWTKGRFEGPGTTVFEAGSMVFMHGDQGRTISTRDIFWNGEGMATGTGTLSLNGAELSIGGKMVISGMGNMYGASINQVPPKITIREEGILIKNGIDFINSLPLDVMGRLELDSGKLTLNAANNWTGEFKGAKNTTLFLNQGLSTWFEGSSLTTDGNFDVNTTLNMDGDCSVGNLTHFDGSQHYFNGSIVSFGDSLIISGGTNHFNDDFILPKYTFIDGGTNYGSNTITVKDTLIWNNGALTDTGYIHVLDGAVVLLTGTQSKTLWRKSIINEGIMLLNEGALNMTSGSEIQNHGSFIAFSDGVMRKVTMGGDTGGAVPAFFNTSEGVFIRKGGDISPGFAGINYYNDGLFELDHAIFNLDGGYGGGEYLQSSGITKLDSSRFIATKEIRIDSGLFIGSGFVDGNLYNAGIVDPGFDSTNNSVIYINGKYTQDTTGTLIIDISGRSPLSGYDQLTTNTASLGGILDLHFHIDSLFNPYYGTRFRVMRWLESEYEGGFDSITNISFTIIDANGPPEEGGFDPVYTVNDLTIFGTDANREMWFQFIGRNKGRNNQKQVIKMFYGNHTRDTLVVPFIINMSGDVVLKNSYKHFPDQLPWDPEITSEYFSTEVPEIFLDEDDNRKLPLVFSLPPDGKGPEGQQGGGTNLVFTVKPNCEDLNNPSKIEGNSGNPFSPDVEDCLWNLAGEIAGILPGGACVQAGANIVLDGFDNRKPKTWGEFVAEHGWDVASCGVSLIPGAALVTKTAGILGGIMSGLGHSNTISSCGKVLLPDLMGKEARLAVNCVASLDPNEKAGPEGISDLRYIQGNDPSAFTIYFENVDTATAPAQNVYITDQFTTEHWDLSTFSFLPITIGDTTLAVPMYTSSFEIEADLREQAGVIVLIAGELDEMSGLVRWTFASLDTTTHQPVSDPMAGFLPPNVNYPEGQADVSYLVQPNLDLISGTEIGSDATIIFDTNEPILTNTWMNTIDKEAPVSQMTAMTGEIDFKEIPLSWSGLDHHSGILGYTVYISENGLPFEELLSTRDTSYLFIGESCTEYQFYTRAIDSAGNQEAPKIPEVMLTVNPYISFGISLEGDSEFCMGDSALLRMPSDTSLSYTWYRNDVELTDHNDSLLYVKESGLYKVLMVKNENCGATSDVVSITGNPLPLAVITSEGNTLSTGAGFDVYQWYLNDVLIADAAGSSILTTESGEYKVIVTNDKGCSTVSDPQSHLLVSVKSLEEEGFIIYPNPGNGLFTIKTNEKVKGRNIYISIVDINGRYLKKSVLMNMQEGSASINISQYPEGIYHFILEDKSGVNLYKGRFILKR